MFHFNVMRNAKNAQFLIRNRQPRKIHRWHVSLFSVLYRPHIQLFEIWHQNFARQSGDVRWPALNELRVTIFRFFPKSLPGFWFSSSCWLSWYWYSRWSWEETWSETLVVVRKAGEFSARSIIPRKSFAMGNSTKWTIKILFRFIFSEENELISWLFAVCGAPLSSVWCQKWTWIYL